LTFRERTKGKIDQKEGGGREKGEKTKTKTKKKKVKREKKNMNTMKSKKINLPGPQLPVNPRSSWLKSTRYGQLKKKKKTSMLCAQQNNAQAYSPYTLVVVCRERKQVTRL
jgi:hypothetical protein